MIPHSQSGLLEPYCAFLHNYLEHPLWSSDHRHFLICVQVEMPFCHCPYQYLPLSKQCNTLPLCRYIHNTCVCMYLPHECMKHLYFILGPGQAVIGSHGPWCPTVNGCISYSEQHVFKWIYVAREVALYSYLVGHAGIQRSVWGTKACEESQGLPTAPLGKREKKPALRLSEEIFKCISLAS